MPSRRILLLLTTVLFVTTGIPEARAGLFDDDEAREQVQKLSKQLDEWVDTVTKAQIDLISQVQALREENAKLRGQIELLTFELDAEEKRQQDFYLDLDTRLRKFEPQSIDSPETPDAGKKPPETAESHDYETALKLFQDGKLKEAARALESFGKHYPKSSLLPDARYWLGNAYYSLNNCKRSIETHKQFAAKWPKHVKSSDAILSVATCQQELGDEKNARTTLEALLNQYPSSSAAATAKQRLNP
ncbi:MAG: tol-pal system protein YbgF [Candidatus Accumulibacter sp.]|jgi:tol-pal system protein YbgF|nr:tol-pal system protein YbgF [Accumulibacter sp.]